MGYCNCGGKKIPIKKASVKKANVTKASIKKPPAKAKLSPMAQHLSNIAKAKATKKAQKNSKGCQCTQ